MKSHFAALALLVIGVGATTTFPSAAAAATCADHRNQASAQRAKDTRDAAGDGIYCEALPCPCLKPGDPQGGGGTSRPRPRARPRPKPKPSSRATTLTARITAVVDGDTVKVRRRFGWDGARFVVRVEQVLDDAPTDFYR